MTGVAGTEQGGPLAAAGRLQVEGTWVSPPAHLPGAAGRQSGSQPWSPSPGRTEAQTQNSVTTWKPVGAGWPCPEDHMGHSSREAYLGLTMGLRLENIKYWKPDCCWHIRFRASQTVGLLGPWIRSWAGLARPAGGPPHGHRPAGQRDPTLGLISQDCPRPWVSRDGRSYVQ